MLDWGVLAVVEEVGRDADCRVPTICVYLLFPHYCILDTVLTLNLKSTKFPLQEDVRYVFGFELLFL